MLQEVVQYFTTPWSQRSAGIILEKDYDGTNELVFLQFYMFFTSIIYIHVLLLFLSQFSQLVVVGVTGRGMHHQSYFHVKEVD